jgi:hypothetical protein
MHGPNDEKDRDARKPLAARETLDHFRSRLKEAKDPCVEMWEAAEANQRFVGGGRHQWDEHDWKSRQDQKLPTFTANDIILAVNGLSGQEATNRYVTSFEGRGEEDRAWVSALRELDRFSLQKANSGDKESDAFRDLLIDRFSWVEHRVDFMKDFNGRIEQEHPLVWDMIWDPTARDPNLLDREWDARGHWYSTDAFLSFWPEHEDALRKEMDAPKNWTNDKAGKVSRWPWLYRMGNKFVNKTRREVFVINYQWCERAPAWLSQNPLTGAIVQFKTEDEALEAVAEWQQQLEAAMMQQGQMMGEVPPLSIVGPKERIYRTSYKQATIVGEEVLEEGEIPYGMFTRSVMTSFPVKKREGNDYNTLTDLSQDLQRLKNSVLSLEVSHLARANKGNILVEEDFFVNDNEAMVQFAKVGQAIKVRRGALAAGKFQQLEENTYPDGLARWLDQLDGMVWRPLGLNPAVLGSLQDPRRVSGKVFAGLAESASIVLAQLFNALKLYRQESGGLRLRMYAEHFTPERIRDIVGPKYAASVPEKESGDEWARAFDRDVVVTEQQVSATEQMQTWDFLTRTDLIGSALNTGNMPWTLLPKMIPQAAIGEVDRQEWIDHIKQGEFGRFLEQIPSLAPEQIQQIVQALQQMAQQQQPQGAM